MTQMPPANSEKTHNGLRGEILLQWTWHRRLPLRPRSHWCVYSLVMAHGWRTRWRLRGFYNCPSGLGVTNKTISSPRQIQMTLRVVF
jgi:hypothetical protein